MSNLPASQNIGTDYTSGMDLKDLMATFMRRYPEIRSTEKFGVHDELWKILGRVTNRLTEAIRNTPHSEKLKIKWSVGKGVWVNVPWIALMHKDETTTTQRGIYCVYLFAEDMSSVTLAVGLGVTEYLRKYTQKEAHQKMDEVCARYADAFKDLDEYGFGSAPLALEGSGKLGQSYEHGNVVWKKYDPHSLPNEAKLFADLRALVTTYVQVIEERDQSDSNEIHESRPNQRTWVLAIGRQSEFFDHYYEQNKIAIGFKEIGDLSQYEDTDEYLRALAKKRPNRSKRPTNDSRACFDFVHKMKKGDLVFVKRGSKNVIAYGYVDGDFQYEEEAAPYKNTRSIHWINKGHWTVESAFARKTLTDLTPYPDFVDHLKEIVGLQEAPSDIGVDSTESAQEYTIDDALDNLFLPRDEFEKLIQTWQSKKNLILQGPPGVGKTYIAKRLAYALMGEKNRKLIGMVQFHQSYSYEDFVQGYRPTENGFVLKEGIFTKFCKKAADNPEKSFVFIIDEVNRGNLSKIFGEIMMLIERDKRGQDWAVPLTYSEEKFYVPKNIYLLGMMNTADRSLSMVDYALRRRFAFVGLEPQYAAPQFRAFLDDSGVSEDVLDTIIDRMAALNEAIETDTVNLGRGFRIGHSFFCPDVEDDDLSGAWYQQVIETEIVPLLEEYWFDDQEKVNEWRKALLRDL